MIRLRALVAAAFCLLPVAAAAQAARADDGPAGARGADPGAATVAVSRFAEVMVYPRREAPATVVPRNESRIAAEVGAAVVEILVDVGQVAPRGAVLARLDDTDFRLALERARAQRDAAASRLALAERQLARARELQQGNFVSPEALNQRETEVMSLRADVRVLDTQVATAQRQLEKTVLRAPFDAAVRGRSAQLGEIAAPGAPLFTLTQLGSPEVSARIPADEAQRLLQAREPMLEAAGGQYPVRLLRVSPVTDRETRSREARFALAAQDAPPPGSEGRLLWRDPRPHVPPELLVRRGDAIGVFTVASGEGAAAGAGAAAGTGGAGDRARFVAAPGAQEGRPAVLALPPEARIVIRGQAALQDGQPLRIVAR